MKQHGTKQRKVVIIVALIIGMAFLGTFLLLRKDTALTEQAAIESIKQMYPALKDYPSDKLPPRSISALQSGNKWYVAFIQNGSGTPILEARCFIVHQDRSIVDSGTFAPKPDSTARNISPVTCDIAQ